MESEKTFKGSAVWLEQGIGVNYVWVTWAVKPGSVRLIAICSNEAKAKRYAENLPPGLSDYKGWTEKAPLDHGFGFADSIHARLKGVL